MYKINFSKIVKSHSVDEIIIYRGWEMVRRYEREIMSDRNHLFQEDQRTFP